MEVFAPQLIILSALFSFPRRKPGGDAKPEQPKPEPTKDCEDCSIYKRRLALYKVIISRYKEMIETQEFKSIAELRSLVTPEDKSILQVRDELIAEFRPYLYDRDFTKAAAKAYEFCRGAVKNEFLPVDFWLSPGDIVELKVADEMDKALFLCSLLIALENQTAKVVVVSEERMRHSFVTFEYEDKFCLMDPAHEIFATGAKADIVSAYITKGEEKQVYEFNNLEYNEW